MAAIAGIAFFVVVWVVPVLVMDWSISWPKRLSLLERLEPYRPTSVADEAQRWLEDQQG